MADPHFGTNEPKFVIQSFPLPYVQFVLMINIYMQSLPNRQQHCLSARSIIETNHPVAGHHILSSMLPTDSPTSSPTPTHASTPISPPTPLVLPPLLNNFTFKRWGVPRKPKRARADDDAVSTLALPTTTPSTEWGQFSSTDNLVDDPMDGSRPAREKETEKDAPLMLAVGSKAPNIIPAPRPMVRARSSKAKFGRRVDHSSMSGSTGHVNTSSLSSPELSLARTISPAISHSHSHSYSPSASASASAYVSGSSSCSSISPSIPPLGSVSLPASTTVPVSPDTYVVEPTPKRVRQRSCSTSSQSSLTGVLDQDIVIGNGSISENGMEGWVPAGGRGPSTPRSTARSGQGYNYIPSPLATAPITSTLTSPSSSLPLPVPSLSHSHQYQLTLPPDQIEIDLIPTAAQLQATKSRAARARAHAFWRDVEDLGTELGNVLRLGLGRGLNRGVGGVGFNGVGVGGAGGQRKPSRLRSSLSIRLEDESDHETENEKSDREEETMDTNED